MTQPELVSSKPTIRIVGGVAMALVVVAAIFGIAKASGDELITRPEFGSADAEALRLGIVLGATVAGSIVGIVLAWLTRRFLPHSRTAFLAICAVALIGYGILAFARADTTATALWLNAMHIGAAIPTIAALTRANWS